MKSTFALLVMILASVSAPAFADGFVCQSDRDALTVKIYNNTQAQEGTRNAAVMILSDNTVGFGNKTIARFTETNLTLGNEGSVYTANVDHRFNDSGRKGELIGGTNIGALKNIVLDLGFSYAQPLLDGAPVRGNLMLVKRNGEVVDIALDCARYLKN